MNTYSSKSLPPNHWIANIIPRVFTTINITMFCSSHSYLSSSPTQKKERPDIISEFYNLVVLVLAPLKISKDLISPEFSHRFSAFISGKVSTFREWVKGSGSFMLLGKAAKIRFPDTKRGRQEIR